MDTASPDAAPPPGHKWRELGKRLLLLFASFCFSFLALEIYVRATWQSQWHIRN